MKITQTERGFRWLEHPHYNPKPDDAPVCDALVRESSAIGDYPDSYDRPGSSFLWIGEHQHLNREEVGQLIYHLNHWLSTGRLEEPCA